MINIINIHLNNLLKVCDRASSANLPNPSQSRLLAKSLLMVSTILFKLIHCRRSCPYQTHIPLQYIPKLWKFINTSLPDKLSNLGDSRIVFHLKHQAVHLILCHKLFLALFRILIHRTDLIDLEDSSILPNPLL